MQVRAARVTGPHAGVPIRTTGAPLEAATAALVLLHGRGATAESILPLAESVTMAGLAVLAPQAASLTWYPRRFTAPLVDNEPWLSSALAAVGDVVAQAGEVGVPRECVVLVGFSQGACLALEWAARNAARLGGVVGLSGGLIGPDGSSRDYTGSLAGTPVLLGCSDVDGHIPVTRVQESASVLRRLGGDVDERIYPGMGHTVNDDEIAALAAIVRRAVGTREPPPG
ncbi:MAG: dienelactone hydrolase family protein [Chloroflexi bacterium]|nr:dienelactone hydrolase family protein [Chloroflexota bacterium]